MQTRADVLTSKHVTHNIRAMTTPTPVTDSTQYTPTQSELCELRRVFAKRLASRMKAAGLDQKAVEQTSMQLIIQGQLQRGINRTSLYKYLAGETLPTQPLLEVLCRVLCCEPEDLVPNNIAAMPAHRGRRKIMKQHAYVANRRTRFGLEYGRLVVDVVLPHDQAQSLAILLRNKFKSAGYTLEPAGEMTMASRTQLH